MNELLGDQLENTSNGWIWTETEHEDYPGQFILRHQSYGGRSYYHPEVSFDDDAVRFIEDK